MRVLMIGGDPRILEPGTAVRERFELQQSTVEQLDVFVWPQVHSQVTIWRAIRKNSYDVITVQDPFWRGLAAWKLARLAGIKLNVQVHADLAGQSVAKRVLARFVLKHADSVRVVSEKIKQQVIALEVVAPIAVLPVYVDLSKFSAVVPRAHTGKSVLWIGRFEEEKNPLEAIEVLKEVLKEIPDVHLTMIGEGTWRTRLSEAAKNLPVTVSLDWQDPLTHLATADILLSTSRHESWGAVFWEALAAGVPVVAPDVGSAEEAGAFVVPHEKLVETVVSVLRSGAKGTLKKELLTAPEWAKRWKATLE